MVHRLVLSIVVLYTFLQYISAQTSLPFASLGPSSSNFMTDTSYFGSSLPIHETTTGFTSTNTMGHALGLFNSGGTGAGSFIATDALTGYAYGANTFDCSNFDNPMCLGNSDICQWYNGVCTTRNAGSYSVRPSIPLSPLFHSKLHFHAKGTVRSIFVDIDTRTRIGEMAQLKERAVEYFYEKFGLNFEYFNTFEGAQLLPFKWTDEMYLQVQDALLPQNSDIIPERNRVLVDGFMVKPMFGETVVLRGQYAASKGRTSVFLEPDEILLYLEYRVVDEFNRLYHKFRFVMCEPLKTNRVGIAGWTASIIRIDHELEYDGLCYDCYGQPNPDVELDPCLCSCYDASWGVGVDQGILEVVEYDGLTDFAFSNLITFSHPEQRTRYCATSRNPDTGEIVITSPENPYLNPVLTCEQTIGPIIEASV